MLNNGVLRKIVLYTTILSVFSENIFYRTPLDEIDIRFYYLVFIVNLGIFLLSAKQITLNKYHILALCALLLSGVIGIYKEPDIASKFILSIMGISLCSIYFYIFIKNIGLSYVSLFNLYVKISFWISLHALVKLFIYLITVGRIPNEYGVFTEPAHYCVTLLPACFYYFKNSFLHRRVYAKGIVIMASVLLSGSSLGLIGFLAMIPFIFKKIKFVYILVSLIIITGLGAILYFNFEKFNDRLSAATVLFQEGVEGKESPNQSSFSLVSNFMVAIKSCKESYGFGSGLGSHHTSYFKYIDIVMPGAELLGENYYGMNSKDGSGLFNRVLSDLGLWGLFFIGLFIYRFFIKGTSIYAIISNAIIIAFVTRLIRDGMYFTPDIYFFIWGYYFVYKEYKSGQFDTT